MRVERVFHVSDASVTAYVWCGGTFEPEVSFAQDEDGHKDFRAYVQRESDKVSAVLAAVAEEEHRIESVPHVRRGDRRAMAERRLARAYRRTDFRDWTPQGPDPRHEKHDRILLSALTRPALLSTWLEILDECRVPITGLYSTTGVSRRLLSVLGVGTGRTLLAALYGDGRLRHSLFDQHGLQGARLLPRPKTPGDGGTDAIARRLEESLRYFDPSYIPRPGAEIDAVIIADRSITEAIGDDLPRSDYFVCHTFSIQSIAEKVGLPTRDGNNLLERVFAHLVRDGDIAHDYSTTRIRRYYNMTRLRAYGRVACFALIFGALCLTGLNAVDIADEFTVDEAQLGAIDQLQAATRNDRETLQDLPVEVEALERSIATFDSLADHATDPQLIMQLVGRMLNRHPSVRIDEFNWTTERMNTSIQLQDGTSADKTRISVTLGGHMEAQDDDIVDAYNSFEDFVATLRSRPEIVDVTPLRTPLDTRPQAQLNGEFGRGQRPPASVFEVRMAVLRRDALAGSER